MAKMVEVDEAELLKVNHLRQVLGKIAANPEAKELLEKAYKTVDPAAPTPTLDARKQEEERINALRKDFDDYRTAQEDKAAKDAAAATAASYAKRVEDGFAKLRAQGVTQEGIAEVQKIMDNNGIADPEIAFAYFEKLHPPQQVVTPGGSTGGWNFQELQADTSEDVKKLIESKGESAPLVDKMVRDALQEFRGATPRR